MCISLCGRPYWYQVTYTSPLGPTAGRLPCTSPSADGGLTTTTGPIALSAASSTCSSIWSPVAVNEVQVTYTRPDSESTAIQHLSRKFAPPVPTRRLPSTTNVPPAKCPRRHATPEPSAPPS